MNAQFKLCALGRFYMHPTSNLIERIGLDYMDVFSFTVALILACPFDSRDFDSQYLPSVGRALANILKPLSIGGLFGFVVNCIFLGILDLFLKIYRNDFFFGVFAHNLGLL